MSELSRLETWYSNRLSIGSGYIRRPKLSPSKWKVLACGMRCLASSSKQFVIMLTVISTKAGKTTPLQPQLQRQKLFSNAMFVRIELV